MNNMDKEKELQKIVDHIVPFLNDLNNEARIEYADYSRLYDETIKAIEAAFKLGESTKKDT